MNRDVARAVFECCKLAATGQTQSGKHVDPVVELLVSEMARAGYDEHALYSGGRGIVLPGWFRPSKKWDITAYEDGALVCAIELKSISKSFGNNANNRVEECIGSVMDVEYATRNHLLEPTSVKPSFGYVLVINSDEESAKPRDRRLSDTPVYGVDPVFDSASYIDRFSTMGQRLLDERIYQAVWVVTVDLETGQVCEPSPTMTFEKFMANVKSWIDIFRA